MLESVPEETLSMIKTALDWAGALGTGVGFLSVVGILIVGREIDRREDRDAAEQTTKLQAAQDAASAAMRQAEEQRIAGEALEKKFAARVLTEQQLAGITGKLAPFRGQRFAPTTFWELPEPKALTVQVDNAARAAGWVRTPEKPTTFLLTPQLGVVVLTIAGAPLKTVEAANALQAQLAALDVEAVRQENPAAAGVDAGIVYVNVGTK